MPRIRPTSSPGRRSTGCGSRRRTSPGSSTWPRTRPTPARARTVRRIHTSRGRRRATVQVGGPARIAHRTTVRRLLVPAPRLQRVEQVRAVGGTAARLTGVARRRRGHRCARGDRGAPTVAGLLAEFRLQFVEQPDLLAAPAVTRVGSHRPALAAARTGADNGRWGWGSGSFRSSRTRGSSAPRTGATAWSGTGSAPRASGGCARPRDRRRR